MSTNRNDLPPPSAGNFSQRVRETLMTYLGRQGNPLDRGLTLRDLIDAGIASIAPGWRPGSNTTPLAPVTPGSGGSGGSGGGTQPDLTPPPTPTGFVATGAISHVFIEHDNPIFSQGNGYMRTHVYGAKVQTGKPLPVFADAVLVGQFSGAVWAMPSDPATTWRLWIKWETQDGVLSVSPAGGANGLEAKTGQDVKLLLDALTGQITESQLYADLGERIDLIDVGPNALVPQVTSINGKYTVKIDNNGYVSGFGLASTANNATPTSEFAIRADKFYIASPSGPGIAPAMPFIVQTTAATIGGVSVPAGVYMADAFIRNGTITNAKIANAAIDDAKIANLSASKLTAGSITTGEYIQSANYVAGSSGWRINGNGTAEFAAASIRGQLTASQIDTRGLTIKDASGNVIFGSGTALSTSYISGLGSLATQSSVSTSQVSGLGTLATQNSVTTSQVSGLGSLATQNSVNYNTQVTNRPALGGLAGQDSVFIDAGQVRIWNGSSYVALSAGSFVSNLNRIGTGNISTFIDGLAVTSAHIGNAAISTAKIADLAVDSAKIANLAVTSAKIANAAITSAKIGDAEVGTLKIAGNAVTVPGSATGTYSAQIFLNTDVATNFAVIATFTQGSGKNGHNWYLAINGTVYVNENPIAPTTGAMTYNISLPAGTHNFSVYTSTQTGSSACGITVIGVKR